MIMALALWVIPSISKKRKEPRPNPKFSGQKWLQKPKTQIALLP